MEPHDLRRDYQRLWFNGTEVGETAINAALCGTWGCPVLLVTGDRASCEEATELLGAGLTTVAVKQGLGELSARMIPPVRAREMIEDGARRALADLDAVAPYDPGSPCEIKVEFKRTQPADRLRFHPGVERLDGRTIRVEADRWWDAWKLFFFDRQLRAPRRQPSSARRMYGPSVAENVDVRCDSSRCTSAPPMTGKHCVSSQNCSVRSTITTRDESSFCAAATSRSSPTTLARGSAHAGPGGWA
ncbi:MAG: M55 family metallopeptidase, partial [Solirubrobacterales bacterium]|nr:M55 family metallopeptidase [Solirubrobacterales bacterium]